VTGFRRAREPKNPLPLHERALGLLAVRARSRRELQLRLLRAGFERTEVDDELSRLEAVGLLDDERFAEELTEQAVSSRKQGRRAIASALASKGVSPSTIARAIEDLGEGEEARADALAADRVKRLAGLPAGTAFRRLYAFLVRRGYEHGLARRVATRALRVEPDPE
jgi:regulatory protein